MHRLLDNTLRSLRQDLHSRLDTASIERACREVARNLRHWKGDPDLAGIRDAEALAKLPEAEAGAWRAPWAEVDALLARAEGKGR